MKKRVARTLSLSLLAMIIVALTGAGADCGEVRWVGTWAASPQLTEPANMPPDPGLVDATLRQVVHVSLGGKRLRIRLSNAFGTKPLTILGAHVAGSAGDGAIKPGSGKPLTFGGRAAVTIPTGAPMVSDPIDFDLVPLSDLAVTIRVKDPSNAVTGHPGARCTSYLTRGDALLEPELPKAARTPRYGQGVKPHGPIAFEEFQERRLARLELAATDRLGDFGQLLVDCDIVRLIHRCLGKSPTESLPVRLLRVFVSLGVELLELLFGSFPGLWILRGHPDHQGGEETNGQGKPARYHGHRSPKTEFSRP